MTRAFPVQPRFIGPIDSRERIEVAVDEDGRPRRVSVVQRLLVHGLGDYYFTIPAPVREVSAAAGSESEPGRRQGQILWQGFSPRNRVLGARAELEPGATAHALPLRLRITRRGSDLVLVVRNATRTRVPSFAGAADALEVARFLDALSGPQGRPRPDTFVSVAGPVRQVTRTAFAPLSVQGELVAGSRVAFRGLLTEVAPSLRVVVRDAAPGRPTLRLTARPDVPAARLRPPRGRTWVEYVRARPRLDRRALLDTALETVLDVAVQGQYDTLLANPDRSGKRSSVYVYTLAAPSRGAQPAAGRGGEGGGLPALALLGGLLVVTLGAVVWWAHS